MQASSGKVFICYRRQDTAWPARQLYELLTARFGPGSVFKDVNDIQPGDDFAERITMAVAACDVLLVMIGPQWLTLKDKYGEPRLDDPCDFVRLEVSGALGSGVKVVPILVDGAPMPQVEQLPPDMAGLARRQAVEITPVGFNTDRLLATLALVLGQPPDGGAPALPVGLRVKSPASGGSPGREDVARRRRTVSKGVWTVRVLSRWR